MLKILDGRFNDVLQNTYGNKLIYELDYILDGLNIIKINENETDLRKK